MYVGTVYKIEFYHMADGRAERNERNRNERNREQTDDDAGMPLTTMRPRKKNQQTRPDRWISSVTKRCSLPPMACEHRLFYLGVASAVLCSRLENVAEMHPSVVFYGIIFNALLRTALFVCRYKY